MFISIFSDFFMFFLKDIFSHDFSRFSMFSKSLDTLQEAYNNGSPIHSKLDVDPRRDDDASPMSSYRCMLITWYLLECLWIEWRHKSKYTAKAKNCLQNMSAETTG